MRRKQFLRTCELLRLASILSMLLFIVLLLIKYPPSGAKLGYFDIRSAILISLGFAGGFRAMLWCRKKV
jgi:hypothetical protein